MVIYKRFSRYDIHKAGPDMPRVQPEAAVGPALTSRPSGWAASTTLVLSECPRLRIGWVQRLLGLTGVANRDTLVGDLIRRIAIGHFFHDQIREHDTNTLCIPFD